MKKKQINLDGKLKTKSEHVIRLTTKNSAYKDHG